jgi:tRNA-specific 2-thiouridylase
LGEYSKEEVRQMARDFTLPVAERNDSQDLCFISDGDYRDFLSRNSDQDSPKGKIINHQGEHLGEHGGLANYTIGQRRGLGVSSTTPLYVVDKDLESNILIVGPKNQLARNRLWAENVNWVSIQQPVESFHAQVKIRYRSSEAPATVIPTGEDSVEVLFDHPIQDITPGQAAVFYEDEQCLGGGIIQRSV